MQGLHIFIGQNPEIGSHFITLGSIALKSMYFLNGFVVKYFHLKKIKNFHI